MPETHKENAAHETEAAEKFVAFDYMGVQGPLQNLLNLCRGFSGSSHPEGSEIRASTSHNWHTQTEEQAPKC
jgi:hypothetical protein